MKKLNKVRILLADDNPALRSALALLLETRLNVSIVGESTSMERLLAELPVIKPDIIILDLELPGMPKENRVAFLHKTYPAIKVVVIGSQPENVQQSPAMHADAYISNSEPPEQMVQALQAI
jgi:DNA-binding NarL/FixJ family response regulator